MKQQFGVFLIRWLVNTAGLWLVVRLFGTGYTEDQLTAGLWGFLLAGLIFSVVNSVLRPIVIILSLPAIMVTLGLFTLVVNGLMVWISIGLAPGIKMTFGYAILTGMVLSLINYIVSSMVQSSHRSQRKEI